ncbi:MAG TPA: class I SAM-dependent methyltransferase [Vitreimonas sp.]|jgi:caffeoyl-CoA O-methyltransferase|nr:class I SAM-dependent methyltransferase [Vitreimonas sp.]
MSSSLGLTPEVVAYLGEVNPPEHPALTRCREETAKLPNAMMQISPEQGAFMQVIARMTKAQRAFEVGVFTGYSSLATMLAMRDMYGDQAHLLACDVSEEYTSKARHYWKEAGVAHLIDLQIRPANETLDQRLAAGEEGKYDLGFIDADKTSYDGYYERGLRLLKRGGVMLFDNVLWSGRVAHPENMTPDTAALRELAFKIKNDPRVHAAMTSIGDGVLMCIKK